MGVCEIWVKGPCHFSDAKKCLHRTYKGISLFSFLLVNKVLSVGLSGRGFRWYILCSWMDVMTAERDASQAATAHFCLLRTQGSIGLGQHLSFCQTAEKGHSISEWAHRDKGSFLTVPYFCLFRNYSSAYTSNVFSTENLTIQKCEEKIKNHQYFLECKRITLNLTGHFFQGCPWFV